MVTTVTTEVLERQKTGRNYLTIPGCETAPNNSPETLDECISRVFSVSGYDTPSRKQSLVYARHLKRYVMERLTVDHKITKKSRKDHEKEFKYPLLLLSLMLKCDHATILHSSRTAQNLIDTDKRYRKLAERVLFRVREKLIMFP